MDDTAYVIFDQSGIDRIRKREPSRHKLNANERYFEFRLHVDDETWEDPPVPEVDVDLPSTKIVEPAAEVEVVEPEEGEGDGSA